jgi:hypothetical protein
MSDIAPINQLLLLVIIGLPVAVVFGGWFAWRAVVILIGLGLLAVAPLAGFALFIVIALWRPLKWALSVVRVFGTEGGGI